MRWLLPLFFGACGFCQSNQLLPEILRRLGEEADVFLHQAPNSVSQEVLTQRALMGNFIQTRVIVSEYGYTNVEGSLHELRKVVSVDNRQIEQADVARRALVMNAISKDTAVKRKLLAEFEKFGLAGAVTDYGPSILLFQRAAQGGMQFELAGESMIGAAQVYVVKYQQLTGKEGLTIFRERNAVQEPMQGAIYVRQRDLLPIRIVINAGLREVRGKKKNAVMTLVIENATIEYERSRAGVLVPVSVVHRELINNHPVVENLFRYTPFRQFTADAEIKFEVLPDPPADPKTTNPK